MQVLLAQHAWPSPPQVPQLPLAQVPPNAGQVAAATMQAVFTQHPPLPQLEATQQGSPGPPQDAQRPAPPPEQIAVAPVQPRPAQQV